MKILAVEFSTDQRSVAIVTSDAIANSSPSPPTGDHVARSAQQLSGNQLVAGLGSQRAGVRGHSHKPLGQATETATRATHAFALIEKALKDAALEREDIGCLAIGLGPGSYHGIRSAIALAQGWQLAHPVKLLGISSAECLAAEAQAQGIFGTVNVVIDAQRQELYLARYEITVDQFREITPLSLVAASFSLPPGELVIGPEATRWFASAQNIFPTAATLGRLAANRSDFLPGEKLEPIYLRETNFVKAPPPRIPPAG